MILGLPPSFIPPALPSTHPVQFNIPDSFTQRNWNIEERPAFSTVGSPEFCPWTTVPVGPQTRLKKTAVLPPKLLLRPGLTQPVPMVPTVHAVGTLFPAQRCLCYKQSPARWPRGGGTGAEGDLNTTDLIGRLAFQGVPPP